MKIVVLDGFTLNPGDLSWDALRSMGPCEIHDRTASEELVGRAAEAGIVLTNKTMITGDHIRALPELKYIGVLATGYNIVDVRAARERNVPVTNVPSYGTQSVAQHTFALLLELTQHVGHHAQTVCDGRWTQCPDFSYWDYPLVELSARTMGIIGFGRIGKEVAGLAKAFGMMVLAANPTPRQPFPGVDFEELETVFRKSEVVSLHCPLTPQTKNLVNQARLASMKPDAFLINTSRGPLIDEQALADALNSGRLAGAAVDVLSVEPPLIENPLLHARNCIITPHIAWATRAARSRLLTVAVDNVRAFLNGKLENIINL